MTRQVRSATPRDLQGICALLEGNGLPISDLVSSAPEFVVACEGVEIIATGAIQRFGDTALLRSVAVALGRRGCGIGSFIVEELERRARDSNVTDLILLTQTATAFFERLGYRVIDKAVAPQAVKTSDEFRSLCPASAVCMSKAL